MPFFSLSSPTSGNATQLQSRSVSATAPATGSVLAWNGSAWVPGSGVTGATGARGNDGAKFLAGQGAPATGYGSSGDAYLDTTNGRLYCPKADGFWGEPLQLQSGAAGPTGATGQTGPAGASITGPAGPASTVTGPSGPTGSRGATGPRGASVLGGNGSPTDAVGIDGDWYVDVVGRRFWGPKAGGTWTSSFSLTGS
ncbi:MAG: hypothetical protein EBR82_54705 [Caulobacteraceae bacterium]|nr:hypothetical protein [Caulobacteraceae bacterium]